MCSLLSLIPSSVSALNRDVAQLQSNSLHGSGSCLHKAPWNSYHEKAYTEELYSGCGEYSGKSQIGEGNGRYKMKVKPESLQDF